MLNTARRHSESLDYQLSCIERDGNDDLLLIREYGAAEYSTQELMVLLRNIKWQLNKASQLQRRLLLLIASISLWIGAGFLSMVTGFTTLGYIFFGLVPLAITASLLGQLYVRRKYNVTTHAQELTRIIQQELDRRRKDASIF